MTQAERLIRNLCEARRLEIADEERTALRNFKEGDNWDELPARVRALVHEYTRLETRQAQIVKTIASAGYQAHSHAIRPNHSLTYKDRDARRARVQGGYRRRLDAVQKHRTDATVASLGKSATEARAILTKLQADLAKV